MIQPTIRVSYFDKENADRPFHPSGEVLSVAVGQTTGASSESVPYKTVRSDGRFELRDYPALTVIKTPMPGGSPSGDGSFMRLFRFISGENQAHEKIAMTTPVMMSGSESNATMMFVLPAKLTAENVPKPADSLVRVQTLPAGRFAVLRFSGERDPRTEAAVLKELKTWMATEGLPVSSPPVYGYFDPPWTLGALRRNEVMLRIQAGQ